VVTRAQNFKSCGRLRSILDSRIHVVAFLVNFQADGEDAKSFCQFKASKRDSFLNEQLKGLNS
jgi:hypothetical protein